MISVADGQLPNSATAIYTAPTVSALGTQGPVHGIVSCLNTSSSLTETVVLTLTRAASAVARRIARVVLGPNEQAFVTGVPLSAGDVIKGQTSDANTVDYVVSVTEQDLPLVVAAFDASGNAKTNSASANGLTVGGNLTVAGATTSLASSAIVESSTNSVAAAGTTQGTAAALPNANNLVNGASGTNGVILPQGVTGQMVSVMNSNASNGLKVYPDAGGSGGTINGAAANAAATLAAAKGTTYVCTAGGPGSTWWSLAN
jgi:hypothetical protein